MIAQYGHGYIAQAFGQRRIYNDFVSACLWVIAVTGKKPIVKQGERS